MKTILIIALLYSAMHSALGQPILPPPPPPNTNTPPPNTNPPTPLNFQVSSIIQTGLESSFINTFPGAPDPTQVLPSWATIHSGGFTVDTNGLIVDTNATPSMTDGMPAGSVVGVVINATSNSPITLTRGEFYVSLANDIGQLDNTLLKVTITRNTTAFTPLFGEPMAEADYLAYDTNTVTLTAIAGLTNVYDLSVAFPLCVVAAPRVVSIRTEPLDFSLPYTQLQWLVGNSDSNVLGAFTTDQTDTNLVELSVVPAMRLWSEPVTGIGSVAMMSMTPNIMNVIGVPGTVIQTSTNDPGGTYGDFWLPDSSSGVGQFDVTQNASQFFTRRIDTSN